MLGYMEFQVEQPEDFKDVIEYIITVCLRTEESSPCSSPTNPTPPSEQYETSSVFHTNVVALTGDLGAGKTTLTQQLAKYIGITEPVTSPTFGIMKSYELEEGPGGGNPTDFRHLVHIDAYRIEDISEAGPLRLQEVFADKKNLVVIEWPEKIAEILPEQRVRVNIEIVEGEVRKVSVHTN